MLRNAKDLHGFTIQAIDGEIGTVDQFYFDDDTWAIRYLTVEKGNWLVGRLVLISPISIIGQPDWQTKRINVSLTKAQVQNSPTLDAHLPVSRQHEIAYMGYYGYPFYWGGGNLWGPAPYPGALTSAARPFTAAGPALTGQPARDAHLRSAEEVTGYYIGATDGEIGHLEGFVFDDESWAIRYIEVGTRNWWPGKKVLIAPAWIESVSWDDSKVNVQLSREAIQSGPNYVESEPITRDYEHQLHAHYGRPPYWLRHEKYRAALSATRD
jgi:hypothetical protein